MRERKSINLNPAATILEDNIASQRMNEKCGYKKEGLLRQAVYKNGKFHNLVVMSVLKEEFDKFIQLEKNRMHQK